MKENFANEVRRALTEIAPHGTPVGYDELAEKLGVSSRRPIYRVVTDLVQAGEAKRLGPGQVQYFGKTWKPDLRDRLWSVVRMRKKVSIEDLMELTGAQRKTAVDFMAVLVRRGCVVPVESKGLVWRMVKDTGPATPENTEKKDYMKRFHARRKEALAQLDAAGESLMAAAKAMIEARRAVGDLEEP